MTSRKNKVLALSVGNALSSMVGLLVAVVMARILLKEDLAAYRQTFLAYATAAPIINLGVSQGIFYFLPTEKTRARGRVLDGLALTAGTGIVFALFIAAGGNNLLAQRFSNPKVAQLLLWMIPYAIITTPSSLFESVLVSRDMPARSAIFSSFRQFVIGASTIIPLVLWLNVESAFAGNIAASLLMAIISMWIMIQSVPSDSTWPSIAGVRELAAFSIPLGLAGMFGSLSVQLDKIIVSVMCMPDEFAVYTVGAFQIPLIGVVTGSITAVALTEMRKQVEDGNARESVQLFKQICAKSSLIILPAMAYLMINADHLIQYLFSVEYAASANTFRAYLLLLPARTVVFGAIIVALGRSRFILWRSSIGLLLNCVLSVVLVSNFGYMGAAFATVVTVYTWAIPVNLRLISRVVGIRAKDIVPWSELGSIGLAIIAPSLFSVSLYLIELNTHLQFISSTIAFALVFGVYWSGRLYNMPHRILWLP